MNQMYNDEALSSIHNWAKHTETILHNQIIKIRLWEEGDESKIMNK